MAIPSRSRNCENMISIAAVEELTYRQSRLCRLLGNPVAFESRPLCPLRRWRSGDDLRQLTVPSGIGPFKCCNGSTVSKQA